MNTKTDPDIITSCEYLFFKRHGIDVRFPVEPTSTISALFICIIVLTGPPLNSIKYAAKLPVVFWFANAGLFFNGIGSVIFHGFDPRDYDANGINPRAIDGLTLGIMTSFTCLMFLEPWTYMIACYFFVMYILYFCYSNDSLSYPFLYSRMEGTVAIGIQFPIMFCLYLYVFVCVLTKNPWRETWPTVVLFFACGLPWILDRFACDGIDALAFLHMFWHMFGAWFNLMLMCFGLKRMGIKVEGRWWPQIVEDVPADVKDPNDFLNYIKLTKDYKY